MKKRYLRLVRQAFRSLRHPRLRHHKWWQAITRPVRDRSLWIPCRDTVSRSMVIGLFFSMILMPFQMLPAAVLAIRLKANVPFAMAACWVSNPLTMGPIILAQFAFGQWLHNSLGIPLPAVFHYIEFTLKGVGTINAGVFLLGMFVSAVLVALAAYPVVRFLSTIMPHYLPVRRRARRMAEYPPGATVVAKSGR